MSSTSESAAPRPPVSKNFKIGVAVASVVLTIVLGALLRHSVKGTGTEPLSSDERLDLVEKETVDGKRLVHPELGFSIAHPGPMYFASDEAEDKFRSQFGDPGTRFYAYAELKTGNMLYITVSKRPGLDSEGYEAMVDTVVEVFTQQTSARMGDNTPVDTAEHEFDHAIGKGTVRKLLSGGVSQIRVESWKSTFGRASDYVVIMVGVSIQSDALADVIKSFRLR